MTDRAELPLLPDPLVMVNRYGHGSSTSGGDGGVFTAAQMRAYAEAALATQAAEIEQLRALLDRATQFVAAYAQQNPKWTLGGITQDPSGVHALLAAIDAARAPKEAG